MCYKTKYDLTRHAKLFVDDARPRPTKKTKSETTSSIAQSNRSDFKDTLQNKFKLKWEAAQLAYEVAKEKDQTLMQLEELRFVSTSTTGISDEDVEMINFRKDEIRKINIE
ncbi:hypothetical protein Tco_1393403 [Tanacetum coccineum]